MRLSAALTRKKASRYLDIEQPVFRDEFRCAQTQSDRVQPPGSKSVWNSAWGNAYQHSKAEPIETEITFGDADLEPSVLFGGLIASFSSSPPAPTQKLTIRQLRDGSAYPK